MLEMSNRPRVGPKENELIKGAIADNSGRNEMRVLRITQNTHPSKSMCPSKKSQKNQVANTRIQALSKGKGFVLLRTRFD